MIALSQLTVNPLLPEWAAMTSYNERDQRILDAALHEFERRGIKRANVAAIAKRAGVGRATVYRSFADKDTLVTAVFQAKVDVQLARMDEAMASQERIEDGLVEGLMVVLTYFRDDALTQRLLAVEPESVIPWLAAKGTPILAVAREHLASLMRAADLPLPPDLDIDVVAEMAVRLVHSTYAIPDGVIGQDDASLRLFARRYLVGVLFPPVRQP